MQKKQSKKTLVNQIFTISDFERIFPGKINLVMEWFKLYKSFEGGKINTIHNNEIKDPIFTIDLIQQVHQQYLSLIKDKSNFNTFWFN